MEASATAGYSELVSFSLQRTKSPDCPALSKKIQLVPNFRGVV